MSRAPKRLLLADYDKGRLIFENGLTHEAHDTPREDIYEDLDGMLFDRGADRNDLARQGWCVVAPAGDRGTKLVALVKKLIDKRRRDSGEGPVFDPIFIEAASRKDTLLQANTWVKNNIDDPKKRHSQIPHYRLILGDLHEVPLVIQQALASNGPTGRLAFDRDADYVSYVEKLLRWEENPSPADKGDAILHTIHDATSELTSAHEDLVKPVLAGLQERYDFDEVRVREIVPSEQRSPDIEALFGRVEGETLPPSLLFSTSHGAGPKPGGWQNAKEQRAHQGAMVFAQHGSILDADKLASRRFLPGGVWFMFGCFGAGTPRESLYEQWLRQIYGDGSAEVKKATQAIPRQGWSPFIAALPKAALANPDGPLAFIGHVDLAWSYAYQEIDGLGSRPQLFTNTITDILEGYRVGVGFGELSKHRQSVETQLSVTFSSLVRRKLDWRVNASYFDQWMLLQDLKGYVLLGDPAARLPLTVRQQPPLQQTRWGSPYYSIPGAQTLSPSAVSLDGQERLHAVLAVRGGVPVEVVARWVGARADEIREWERRFLEAGRTALVSVDPRSGL